MEEKRHISRSHKHKSKKKKYEKRRRSSSSSSSTDSEKWTEKETKKTTYERDDWMSMTGVIKTYTKEDIKPKREETNKKHIDSYNPGTSSRELNPYWKDGGTGLPQTIESYRNTNQFLKPSESDDYYSRSRYAEKKVFPCEKLPKESQYYHRTSNWRRGSEIKENSMVQQEPTKKVDKVSHSEMITTERKPTANEKKEPKVNLYLTDEQMNKLGARIVKAEILGDTKLVIDLKAKLEAAREYRKQNPHAGKQEEVDKVMLIYTNKAGNSRPLTQTTVGDPSNKHNKHKIETHSSGERTKYFGNDDKYNLAEMFQQEKYGRNYNEEAELVKIIGKHKNPNDDLEDIFMDEISKNRDPAKESEAEKQRAIKEHVKLEKSLEGCEYCFDSKNMLKHLMVSCGNKVYLALPSRKSLVKHQCIITTLQHSTCVTAVDEDVWEEVQNYRKALTQYYNSNNMDVVFYETATRLHKHPHMVINCIPLPRDVGDVAAIYFKKALLECETEWAMNKKVVDLRGRNIRRGVPKGLPYFWVDFGMDPGFAHVIEDQSGFPFNFAEEIIGGILDLDHNLWKNPRRENGEDQRKKVVDFLKGWRSYDPIKNN